MCVCDTHYNRSKRRDQRKCCYAIPYTGYYSNLGEGTIKDESSEEGPSLRPGVTPPPKSLEARPTLPFFVDSKCAGSEDGRLVVAVLHGHQCW